MKSTNQSKLLLNEDVYDKNGDYNPDQDSRYKSLLRKPINTLTRDDIAYLFTIHITKRSNGYNSNGTQSTYWYTGLVGWDYDFYKGLKITEKEHKEDFDKTYEFIHSLKFPLKVYRALRDNEEIPQGKNSMSWTTDINIYKKENSMFRNCTRIVEATITADMVQNEYTICNYVYYSANPSYGRYAESEITLKPRFKADKLQNLHFINKDDIVEKIVKKDGKYQVQSEKGKNLGTYDTKKEAEKRLKQVEFFKNKTFIYETKNQPKEKCEYIYAGIVELFNGKEEIYKKTKAVSEKQALSNIRKQVADDHKLDVSKVRIKLFPEFLTQVCTGPSTNDNICNVCGHKLNDEGKCPRCNELDYPGILDEKLTLKEGISLQNRLNKNTQLTNLDTQFFDYIYSGNSKDAQKILDTLAVEWGAVAQGDKPLQLYHGTPYKFTKFDAKKGFNIDAIYFSNSQSVAAHWSATNEYGKGVGIRGFNLDIINDLVDFANRDPNKLFDILNNHLFDNIHLKVAFTDEKYGDNYRLVSGIVSSPLGYKKNDEIYFSPEMPEYDVEYSECNLVDILLDTIQKDAHRLNYINNTLACYIKMENPLIVDANKHAYFDIEFNGKQVTTETIVSYAQQNGYDGVIVKNVYETDYANKLCDDYIVMNPNQIKSCNLIVMDDEGDIIPPSKRFTSSEDIRESLNGKPIKLYHGTMTVPLQIRNGFKSYGKFVWVTDNYDYADLFSVGKYVYECDAHISNPLNLGDLQYPILDSSGDFSECFKRVSSILSMKPEELLKKANFKITYGGEQVFSFVNTKGFRDLIVSLGYDSVFEREYHNTVNTLGIANEENVVPVAYIDGTTHKRYSLDIVPRELGEGMKLNEAKSTLNNERVEKLVYDCIGIMNDLGYIIPDDLQLWEMETTSVFGYASYPTREYNFHPTIQLSKFMFNEPDEAIKNTILHELCHIVAQQMDMADGGIYFDSKYNDLRMKRGFKKSGHGPRWKKIADRVSKATGITISRTDNYTSHTGVGQERANKEKFRFKCPECGIEFGYTKKTEFVKTFDKLGKDGNPSWWCLKCRQRTGKKIQFEIIAGKEYL